MTKFTPAFLLCLALPLSSYAQSTGGGAVQGSVADPSGAAMKNVKIQISNPVSGYDRTAVTDDQGRFTFTNLPANNYHLVASVSGFQSTDQDVNVRSSVPLEIKLVMKIGAANSEVTVAGAGDLIETDPVTHTDIDRALFDKLPLESSSSSLSSLVTLASPGISADSNGLFHGLGDHASNSFSVDGQPISDQQSKVFSNQIPLDSVQSMEVIEGAPPAEYGDKTSVVIVVTTRSGLGSTVPHGEINTSYGTFGTANVGFNLAYGQKNWGNFIAANGMDTGRFLDGPEYQVFHDHGNQTNVFDRFDYKFNSANTVNLNLGFTRSWFQTPNSYDSQADGEDQRSKIRTFNIAPTWTRIIDPNTVFTFGGFIRQDQYNYYPSANPLADFTPNLQSESIGQNRRLTDAGAKAELSYVKGIHNIKLGGVFQHTFLTERDSFGIVDPTFPSDPVLNAYNLTRPGGQLYNFLGHTDIKETAFYIQDAITIKNLTLNLGLRGDIYNGITSTVQAEPRLGVAYNFKPTNTVIRASYARTLETPFNENLVLASVGCNDAVINALSAAVQGYPCLTAPLRPGTRNEFHVGLQQAFGRYLVVDGEYIWKYTNLAYDFSVLGNTPITYPIEWTKSKIPGYAIRATMPNFHGLSAFVVFSSVAARFFGPQQSGIGATPTTTGTLNVFRIDHDETFNQTTHLQYQPWKRGPWIGFNWRYDSGLVAGPVPCAGGNCNNGPNGTDSIVDVSNLSFDQQFEAGLYCGSVHATPTMGISSSGLCPASQYGSTLIKIPAAGTEDDDHNPPRIASRNLFDLAVGHDNIFNGDRYKWSARVTIVNLTNKEALYNFLSTFSGTHYVTPRAVTATLAFHF
jgi:Carboxypeptidase regulatory-like domain/TonB-dependent Receptor Plug Domain